MKIAKLSIIAVTVTLMVGCAEAPNRSENIAETTFAPEVTNQLENNITSNSQISNTSKLNFDESIIDLPDNPQVYQLLFERKEMSKDELINGFTKSSENYLASTNNQTDVDERKFQFKNIKAENNELDVFTGSCPDLIDNNFYSLEYENSEFFFRYQHFAGFYQVQNKNGSGIFGESAVYFDQNTPKEKYESAESYLQKATTDCSYFFSVPDFEVVPYRYQESNGDDYYQYAVKYKDILLDMNYYASIDPDILDVEMGQNSVELTVHNEEIDNITGYYNWDISEELKYDNIMTADNAADIVEKEISDDVHFNVSRVSLVYRIDENRDASQMTDSWSGIPCYKFTVLKSGIASFPKLAFFVDAVTGEFSSYVIAR